MLLLHQIYCWYHCRCSATASTLGVYMHVLHKTNKTDAGSLLDVRRRITASE